MGSIVKGICKHCGFETEDLKFGGGIMNFTTCCHYPLLDKSESEIRTGNIMKKDEVKTEHPDLLFYDDETLSDHKLREGTEYEEWNKYRLYRSGYLCPKCYRFSLGFVGIGLWD